MSDWRIKFKTLITGAFVRATPIRVLPRHVVRLPRKPGA